MWVVGAILAAVRSLAVHPAVDTADTIDRALCVGCGAERGDRQKCAGALEASPRITLVIGMLGDAGHRQRMQRLQQQRPQSADKHRGIGVNAADRSVVGEPSRAGGGMDPGAVLRAFRAGDHGEKSLAEAFADPVEIQVEIERQRHTSTVRATTRNCAQGSRPGPVVTPLGWPRNEQAT